MKATSAASSPVAVDTDYFIESVIATADAVRAKGKHKKHINLSFDEWNVWYQRGLDTEDQPHNVSKAGWREHPRVIEDKYNVTDAVVVGTLLNSLLRHGDRVKIANQAQLVNVIAPIFSPRRTDRRGGKPSSTPSPGWQNWRGARSCGCPSTRTSTPTPGLATRTWLTSAPPGTRKRAAWPCSLPTVALKRLPTSRCSLRGFDAQQVLTAEVLEIPDGGDRFTINNQEKPGRVGLTPLEGVKAQRL